MTAAAALCASPGMLFVASGTYSIGLAGGGGGGDLGGIGGECGKWVNEVIVVFFGGSCRWYCGIVVFYGETNYFEVVASSVRSKRGCMIVEASANSWAFAIAPSLQREYRLRRPRSWTDGRFGRRVGFLELFECEFTFRSF